MYVAVIGLRQYSNFNFKDGFNVVNILNKSNVYFEYCSISRRGPNPWMALTNLGREKEIARLFKERVRL